VNSHGVITVGSSAIFNIADMANAGSITLGDASNAASDLGCSNGCTPTGPTMTNTGTLKTVAGGTAIRRLKVIIHNASGATVDLAGVVAQTDSGCQPGGGLANTNAITNSGTVTIEPGANVSADCGFTNSSGATVVNNGMLDMDGDVFVQRGTESGNPVIFMNGSGLDPDLSSGTGSFLYAQNGGIHPTGSQPGIAAGDTVTVASGVTLGNVNPPITNAGTIILGDNSGSGDTIVCCDYYTAPATITNTGTIEAVAGAGGARHIQVNVRNGPRGVVDIATNTAQDPSCTSVGPGLSTSWFQNDGTFIIEPTASYSVGTCPAGSAYQDTFTQSYNGTLRATINGNTMAFSQLIGGQINLGGVLKVSTIGTPAVNSKWLIVSSSSMNGQFSSLDFGGQPYAWVYASSSPPPGFSPGFTMIRTAPHNPCAGRAWHCQPIGRTPSPAPPGTWWGRPHEDTSS
jgi:hypothetical protein